MSLFWLVLSVVVQLGLALFLFMLVAFSSGGIVNGRQISEASLRWLNLSLFGLPGLCLLSAGLMVYGYFTGSTARAYWWHALPVPAVAIYLLYALSLSAATAP